MLDEEFTIDDFRQIIEKAAPGFPNSIEAEDVFRIASEFFKLGVMRGKEAATK